jgi:uncharacterized protein YecE (DUF72 family)
LNKPVGEAEDHAMERAAMPQLSLFDSGLADLDLAPLPDEVARLAALLPRGLRLGTTSWTFPGWIGVLYGASVRPKQLASRGLTAYVKHPLLRTVELDRTYYEPIAATLYAQLAAQTPEHFRFVAKAHEDCTTVQFPAHARCGARAGQTNPRLLDATYATDFVIAPFVEGLREKAGPLVFQFSPFKVRSPQRFAHKLHDFLRRLPKGPTYAVELRNPQLLTPAYGAALADAGAVHCHNAWGRMPDVLEQAERLPAAARRVLVARWLNRPDDTHEAARQRYSPFDRLVEEDVPRRQAVAELAMRAVRAGSECFVMVSNNAEGCSPLSTLKLAAAISKLG